MRVALLSPPIESVPPRYYGGTERVVYNLCRGLSRAGVEVTLFASADSDPGPDVRLIPTITEAMRLSSTPVSDPHAHYLRMLSLIAARASEFDVIHNHHDYWMLPLSEMTDTPMLTTLHGRLDLPDIAAAFLSYPKVRYDSISHSQRGPMSLLRWMRTIYHGMDLDQFRFHPEPGRYLAFLGRIAADKRPDYAIQIAKASGVPLKIAAKIEGPEMQQYYDAFVKPHVDGRFIEYIGEISDHEKSDFLGNALALVFPIDWPEPFGLVVTESLACGTPVLSRPIGAVPELLSHGVTGYLHSDIRELAARVADISQLDRLRCRSWVEEKFSLSRMVEDYIDVYRQLRAERKRWTAGDRRNFLHSV